jgi:hypothetical protein
MSLINPRTIVIRVIIVAILFAFVYPFLPVKQKWEIQAAFGSREADSLLWEYYQPPINGAQQFALEFQFAIHSDSRQLVGRHDVRYVELGDKLWSRAKQWVVHIRQDAVERLDAQLQERPGEQLWVELQHDWRAPLNLPAAGSPLYIDPGLFSSDQYFAGSVLESWYPPLP